METKRNEAPKGSWPRTCLKFWAPFVVVVVVVVGVSWTTKFALTRDSAAQMSAKDKASPSEGEEINKNVSHENKINKNDTKKEQNKIKQSYKPKK